MGLYYRTQWNNMAFILLEQIMKLADVCPIILTEHMIEILYGYILQKTYWKP